MRAAREHFSFPTRHELEPLRDPDGNIAGVIVRDQEAIDGSIEIAAEPVSAGLFRITVRILNATPLDHAAQAGRDDALMRALVSTHTVLAVQGGQFVSLMDPPECCRAAAAECCNVVPGRYWWAKRRDRDAMLSAPIILYDYPQLAPRAPGICLMPPRSTKS